MYNICPCLSIKFPTTGFVYIHRNQSPNHSTVNKRPIGKNKRPGRQNVHSSEFEILALYIYIINEPSKEEWGSGKRQRKLVTGICVYSTFIGRNLSRCKQTLGRQADRTYIQPPI